MMKKGFNIQQKIQIYILLSVTLIFIIIIGYLSINSRKQILQTSQDLTNAYAREVSNMIENQLNNYTNTAINLQTLFQNYELIPQNARRKALSGYLEKTINKKSKLLSVWGLLEPNAIDTLSSILKNTVGSSSLGNFHYVYYRSNDKIILNNYIEQNANEVFSSELYNLVKEQKKITITEPYYYTHTGAKIDEKLEFKIVCPVITNSQFIGEVGVDVVLDSTLKELETYISTEGSFIFLLSQTGSIINFPDNDLVNKNIKAINFLQGDHLIDDEGNLIKSHFTYITNYQDESYYVSSVPIHFTNTETVWHVQMATPLSTANQVAITYIRNAIITGILGLLLLFIIIIFVTRKITIPIRMFSQVINQFSNGNVDKNMTINIKTNDEFEKMADALNSYITGYVEKIDFASKIGDGEFKSEFKLLSKHDKLGQSLIQMSRNLAEAKETEKKRRDEDDKHRWTNDGIAKFANIMRNNNSDIKKLSFELMHNLINYMNMHQGAIFVIDESDSENNNIYYETTATIAYDRRQYNKTRFKLGENLVGRCAHEQKTIYLKEVPENYIAINSGLGEARPNVILIVPAILNDKVYAIIELASFHEIEPYQITFAEKLSESIASTIANVKVTERTQQLLKESQKNREELSSQEEEMRQNLEELQATQEEATNREFELRTLIEALSISNYMVEYDLDGTIINVNDCFSQLVELPNNQIIGMNHKDGLKFINIPTEKYNQFWQDLRHGISRTENAHIKYNNKDIYLLETYTPLIGKDNTPYKVVKISIDVTELTKTKQQLESSEAESSNNKKEIIRLQKDLNNLQEELSANKTVIEDLQTQLATTNATKSSTASVEIPLPAAGEPLIEWTEKLNNEITELNEQHHQIVDLANQLYIGLRTDKPKKEIKENLKVFVDFTAWHFSNEERYFQIFGFNLITEHTTAHKEFITQIDDFRKKYQLGKIKFYDDVMRYIKNWIEDHFANADQLYVDLFKINGLS